MHPISILFVLVLLIFSAHYKIRKKYRYQSNCGVVLDIDFPFRFRGDSQDWGLYGYELSCEHNHTVLQLGSNKYLVQAINYEECIIRLTDPRLHKNNCSTPEGYSPTLNDSKTPFFTLSSDLGVFLSCKDPVMSPHYVDAASCVTGDDFSIEKHSYSYALMGSNLVASDIEDTCNIHKLLAYGFDLGWGRPMGQLFVGRFTIFYSFHFKFLYSKLSIFFLFEPSFFKWVLKRPNFYFILFCNRP